MIGPPSVGQRYVRRGKWRRILSAVFLNRTVLLVALRATYWFVKIVRVLLGGG